MAKKILIPTFMTIACFFSLCAQQYDSSCNYVIVSQNSRMCSGLKLVNVIKTNVIGLVWDCYQQTDTFFFKKEFEDLREHLNVKIPDAAGLKDYDCVLMASILSDQEFPKEDMEIEVYEIFFKNIDISTRFAKAIENKNVRYLEWPDISIPIKIYQQQERVLLFLDVSEEPKNSNLCRVVEKVCAAVNL